MANTFVLGVTGNIASGKSLVSGYLDELGATVIDSDVVYRDLVRPGMLLLQRIAETFGPTVITAEGELNRATLGGIVFSEPESLERLDALTHPAVIAEVDRRREGVTSGVVVLDAVKLVESGHADRCDEVWLVTTNPEEQVTRLMKRNSLSEAEARRRVAAQPSLDAKCARANRVIDNSGTRETTRNQVLAAWKDLPIHR